MSILTDIYQFLFIASIVFMVYIFGDFIIKMYGRFKANKDTRFLLTKSEKIVLWVAIAYFFTYIL